MSEPPVLSPYVSSATVRIGVSNAYSIRHNPRGMETKWYGPWGHTLYELVSPFPGQFVVYHQHPLWIPALKLEESKLKEEYAKHGLLYNSDDDQVATKSKPKKPPVTRPPARSVRIQNIQHRAEEEEQAREPEMLKALKQRRRALRVAQKKIEKEKQESNPDVSINSVGSITDGGAKNNFPDIFVAHVAGCNLPRPARNSEGFEQAFRHYTHRAGVKTYHSCGGLIIEIKAAPARAHHWGQARTFLMTEAIEDLVEYCNIYFLCQPKAERLSAIAASALSWKWANIERDDVPEWDWTLDMLAPNQHKKVRTFHAKFGKKTFTLAETKSDTELTKIRDEYLCKMLSDGHTPAIPKLVEQMRDGTFNWATLKGAAEDGEQNEEHEHDANNEDNGENNGEGEGENNGESEGCPLSLT